jgi:DNA-directed RNA polymerase subunit M/transcription elongation factor TFIIS
MLTAIVAELGIIIRSFMRSDRESKPELATRETPQAGQTINVNLTPLAPVSVSAQTSSSQVLPAEPDGTGRQGAQKNPVEESPAEKIAREETQREEIRETRQRSVQLNAFAVQCPKCGAENSSYRTECFNCGQPL